MREASVMTILKDSSEIREARELLLQIMAEPASGRPDRAALAPQRKPEPALVTAAPTASVASETPAAPVEAVAVDAPTAPGEPEGIGVVEDWVAVTESTVDQSQPPAHQTEESSRGKQLQGILATLCERAGLTGALITDNGGLAVAASSSLSATENLAAFSTVLGDVLHKAGSYLGQDDASDVSLDINATQKVVLRCFTLEERPFYLLVLCAAASDPREAMREAIPEIVAILAAA
jgi:hypothetical protein